MAKKATKIVQSKGEWRAKYRKSDGMVLGAVRGADAAYFDDADHGTTIEFTGRIPKAFSKFYDNTPGSEKFTDNSNSGAVFGTSLSVGDTDGDGIADLPADGTTTATITIQKKDSAGNDMVGAQDNDQFFVEVKGGSLDKSSGNLVNGTSTIVLQPSTAIGAVVTIKIWGPDGAFPQKYVSLKFVSP